MPTARLNAPARASLFYTLGGVLSRGAAFLLTPIVTRLLTPADYGAYSLFNAMLSALTVIGTLDICGSVFWRSMQKFADERFSLLRSALILISICSGGAMLLFIPFYRLIWQGELFRGGLIFLFIALISNATVNLYSTACKYSCRYAFVLASTVIMGIVAPAAACLAAIRAQDSETALVARVGVSTIVGAVFALGALVYIISSRGALALGKGVEKHRRTLSHIKYLLSLALPMLPYYISLSIIAQSDKLIISRALGEGALGAYAVAHSAGSALTALSAGVCTSLAPWIMRKARAGESGAIRRALGTGLSVAAPLSLCILCAAPEVFAFLAPSGYTVGLSSVYPLTLSSIPLLLSSLITSATLTYERTPGILISGITPAILSLMLNIVFVGKAGIFAAGVISLISYTVMLFISSSVFKKISGKSIISVNKTLHIFLICVFFALAVYAFRDSVAARAFLLILPLSALGINAFRARDLLREK